MGINMAVSVSSQDFFPALRQIQAVSARPNEAGQSRGNFPPSVSVLVRPFPIMLRFATVVLALCLACPQAAVSCTIPVFRFALDRWEADKFHLLLPASASSDPALADLLRPLRANGKANLDIATDPSVQQPVLRFSRDSGKPLWSGQLDAASLTSLLSSPVRGQILDRILAGDSIIWVIADHEKANGIDEAARIEKRLKFLEQVAALPVQDPNDPDSQLGPGPELKLKFTVLRVWLDDPAEQLLISMLAGPDDNLDKSQPFAAAVFGRGRVLGSWPLADLDERGIEDACLFLTGRCSCRVKTQNPGWDLLLNADWDRELKKAGEAKLEKASAETPEPESIPAASQMKAPEPAIVIASAKPSGTSPEPSRKKWAAIGGIALVGLLLLWAGARNKGTQVG